MKLVTKILRGKKKIAKRVKSTLKMVFVNKKR